MASQFYIYVLCCILTFASCKKQDDSSPKNHPISLWQNAHRTPCDSIEACKPANTTMWNAPIRFEKGIALVGAQLPTKVNAGELISITLYWHVATDEAVDAWTSHSVFIHGQIPDSKINQTQADHPTAEGVQAGDIVADTFTLQMPSVLLSSTFDVFAGLYKKDQRLPVLQPPSLDNRVLIASLQNSNSRLLPAKVTAKKISKPIVLDGAIQEDIWQQTPAYNFVLTNGASDPQQSTLVQFAWSNDGLYVAFQAQDNDVFSVYSQNDDPLYNSEALELFIDADGDKDAYNEFQSDPANIHFDASFQGGSRKGMNVTYSPSWTSSVKIQGTLNQSEDKDTVLTVEWFLPWEAIVDMPQRPQSGQQWKLNAYRLERKRQNTKVIATEASALWPPLANDFHRLEKMGILEFVE